MSPCFVASYLTDSRPQINELRKESPNYTLTVGSIIYNYKPRTWLFEKVSVGRGGKKKKYTLHCIDTTSTINHNRHQSTKVIVLNNP